MLLMGVAGIYFLSVRSLKPVLSCCPNTSAPKEFRLKNVAERHLCGNEAEGWVLFIFDPIHHSNHLFYLER